MDCYLLYVDHNGWTKVKLCQFFMLLIFIFAITKKNKVWRSKLNPKVGFTNQWLLDHKVKEVEDIFLKEI